MFVPPYLVGHFNSHYLAMVAPWYATEAGAVVVDAGSASPLYASLFPGDVITRIGVDCRVKQIADIAECFSKIVARIYS
jgi:hypothetical protein